MSTTHELAALEADFNTVLVPGSIKAAMKQAEAGSRDLWQIDPRKLKTIDGFNPRVHNAEYEAHIRDIADSIKQDGFLQSYPLGGYVAMVDGEPIVYIYSGHTRLAATLLAISEGAEIVRVPVVVSQSGVSMEDLTVELIRGNAGRSLSFYESAIVCKRLIRYGLTEEEISARTGIMVPLVRNRLTLMAAPLKLREMVANDQMSATLAIELINTHGEKALDKAEEAIARAQGDGKAKARKAHTGISPRVKFVKKRAANLYEAASKVRSDPGFTNLSGEVQELLLGLLSEIDEREDTPAIDPRQVIMDLESTVQ